MSDQPDKLSCSVCRKEIPQSAKKMPEGAEYISHFCSTECQGEWRKDSNNPNNLAEITANPERFYDSPNAILQDENLTNDSRLKILKSWENDAIELQKADEENMSGGRRSRLSEVRQAILSLRESS